MPLTVVDGHNYVQMIALEPIRVRVFGLQPQLKDVLLIRIACGLANFDTKQIGTLSTYINVRII
jgi:hypothetical protein